MMRKPILSVILAIVLFITFVIPASAKNTSIEIQSDAGIAIDSSQDAIESNYKEISDLQLIGEVTDDPFTILIKNMEKYPDIYAGIYYSDQDEKYHIMSLDKEKMEKLISTNKTMALVFSELREFIVFDNTEYSLSQLRTLQNVVVDNMVKYDIDEVDISYENNNINIYAEEWPVEAEKAISALLSEKSESFNKAELAPFDNVNFEVEKNDLITTATTYIRGGWPIGM